MLQSTKNEVTLSILRRLRQQGAPAGSSSAPGGPILGGAYDDEDGTEGDGRTVISASPLPAALRKRVKKKPGADEGPGGDAE